MPTFLFDKTIFGPVNSRRLGVSLGINLLPNNRKICSFDCIYCECGLNPKAEGGRGQLPTKEEVKKLLETKLKEMEQTTLPDVITFAGNGEPTLHPDFATIIEDTLALRNRYCPKARIAVLSNTTNIHKPDIFEALCKIDDNIQKLDSALPDTIKLIDQPNGAYDLNRTLELLKKFHGKVVIQTLFVRGTYNEKIIDNTTPENIEAWLLLIKEIAPKKVMIYTIDRATPIDTLKKVPIMELKAIAQKVEEMGFSTQVSG